jgi:hypothetical protein
MNKSKNNRMIIKTIVVAKGKSIELDPNRIGSKKKKSGW